MKAPPYLPEETLARVLRVARFDGISVLGVAGLFALFAAGSHDVMGAVFGLLVAGAGAIELSGTIRLTHADPQAMRWLVASQLCILATIGVYVAVRLSHPDPTLIEAFKLTLANNEEQRLMLRQNGFTEAQFIRLGCAIVYFAVALATLVYQGGMIIYYLRRREAVRRALEEPVESDSADV